MWETYRQKADILEHWGATTHEACFNKAALDNEQPFLTMQEALAYRNCISKAAIMYQTLKFRLQNREFIQVNKEVDELVLKKQPDIRAMVEDPWKEEGDQLREKYAKKKAYKSSFNF